MTIEVAVRTNSAVVFAADSKLTTSGLVGLEQNGKPRFVQQSYDNAVKLGCDRNGLLMAMIAGQITLGDLDPLEDGGLFIIDAAELLPDTPTRSKRG